MNHRHAVVSTMLALSFSGLALAFGTRTDQQAQARTAADINQVGSAMYSWLTDQVGAAAAGQSQVPIDLNDYPAISRGDLESILGPTYLPEVPELDGWDHSYDFRFNADNPLAQHVMAARSPGRNGAYSGTSYTVERFAPDNFDEDLVWADGFTVRWPGSRTDREAQDQTVADIRRVGAAMLAWLTDQVGFTGHESSQAQESTVVNLAFYPGVSHASLESLLVPQYIANVPDLDGWGAFYEYYLNVDHPLTSEVMAIRSTGRDQSEEGPSYLVTQFDRDDFDQDIVWADGSFVRWPDENGLSFYSVPPCRILDTRSGSPLQSGVATLVQLAGDCEVPTSAKSVTVTVTVIGPTGLGNVNLYPGGLPAPTTSTINFAAGQTRANNAILGFSGDATGSIGALATVAGGGQVHLVVDVTGYFD
jgi:hypothetical protein